MTQVIEIVHEVEVNAPVFVAITHGIAPPPRALEAILYLGIRELRNLSHQQQSVRCTNIDCDIDFG
jgi:hypothetical protein